MRVKIRVLACTEREHDITNSEYCRHARSLAPPSTDRATIDRWRSL